MRSLIIAAMALILLLSGVGMAKDQVFGVTVSHTPNSSFRCDPSAGAGVSLGAAWTSWLTYDIGYDITLQDCGGAKCLKIVPFAY